MIPDEVIAEVKRRADLGEIIGRSIALKKRGRNLVGLCPFHQEKTPSFNVRADEGFYKCFGCGASGDVFTYLEQTSGQRFIDVLRGLAAETGVELPEERLDPEEEARRLARQRVLRVLELAQIFFRQKLQDDDEGRAARAYLKDKRGLPDDVIDGFGLGFGGARDNGLIAFLARHGVEPELMRTAGVVAAGQHGDYDFFRQRVVFPIRGRRGEVLTFGGRAFGRFEEGRPKYLNGPSSPVYDKSRELYGLFEALRELKRGRPAILVEGYFDVIAMHRAGLPAAVAPCGTALTDAHLDELARHTKTVVVCLDSDDAGRAATEKAVLMGLRHGLDVRIAELVEKDADSAIAQGGGEALRLVVEGAKDAVDVLVEKLLARAVGRIGNRTAALESALPYLAALPDARLSTAAIVGRVASVMGVDAELLRDDVRRRGRELLRKTLGGRSEPPPAAPARAMVKTTGAPGPASDDVPARAAPPVHAGASRAARVLRAPAQVAWTEAERSLVRALLCQPHLTPRCGVLVDVFKNVELKGFVRALGDALVRFPGETPRDILRRVPVSPEIARIYAEIFTRRGVDDPDQFLGEGLAAQIIEDFVLTLERRPLERRLGEIQRAIQSASDRGDLVAARHLIEAQRAVVNALSEPEAREGPPRLEARSAPAIAPPSAPPAPAAPPHEPLVVEPDGFVDDPVEAAPDEGLLDGPDDGGGFDGLPEEEDFPW